MVSPLCFLCFICPRQGTAEPTTQNCQQAHNRKVQRKVYYPYEKSPYKIKTNQKKKKVHTQKPQKDQRKAYSIKKKKNHKKQLNNNNENTYKQINRTGHSNNRMCLSILARFQPRPTEKPYYSISRCQNWEKLGKVYLESNCYFSKLHGSLHFLHIKF